MICIKDYYGNQIISSTLLRLKKDGHRDRGDELSFKKKPSPEPMADLARLRI